MKPLHLFISALALAAIVVPLFAPVADGTPVSTSQYSIYRVWYDASYSGSAEDHYGNVSYFSSENMVRIAGRLQVGASSAPYIRSASSDYAPGYAYTIATFTLCWLDDDMTKRTMTLTESGYASGVNGRLSDTLYNYEYNVDILFEEGYVLTSRAPWLEDIVVTVALYSTVTYDYYEVAEWTVSAAFCEQIYLLGDYVSSDDPDYRISDTWDHPSASSSWWQGVEYEGYWHHPLSSKWGDSMAEDWDRHEAILSDRSTDDVTNRSGLYGYAESMLSRIESVLGWQEALAGDTLDSPCVVAVDTDGDDYSEGRRLALAAWNRCKEVQSSIVSGGDYNEIRDELTRALRDYQLAVLYTDREVILNSLENVDYEFDAIADYVDTNIDTNIELLETGDRYNPDEDFSFLAWLAAGSNAVIVGAAVSLATVAIIWRNTFVAIMAVAAGAASVLSYLGGIS